MKKIKIKYININSVPKCIKLLSIGAALTIAFTGCSPKIASNASVTTIATKPKTLTTISTTTTTKTEPIPTTTTQNIEVEIDDIALSNKGVSVYNSDFEISDKLQTKINNYIKKFNGDSSFIAINLKDGMSFGYNIDKSYQTASTIKVAFALFCFKEIENGNGSFQETKVYESRFKRDGSGILKDKKVGTSYTIKDLIYYTLNYSDNIAYYMIHDRFYSDKYNDFLKELGCNQLYLKNGAKWGYIDARSMALVWQEIYKYKDESEYGKILFDILTNAEYNYMEQGMDKYESAHKSGWTQRETHDSGIVFANDDYIVVTLQNNNGNYSAKQQLINVCGCIEDVIEEYDIYKKENYIKTK